MSSQPVPSPQPVAVPGWEHLPWLLHGFSTRTGGVTTAYGKPPGAGDLNLGFTPADDCSQVERNRSLLLQALGAAESKLVTLRQIHSAVIHKVDAHTASGLEGDGLITDGDGVLLGILTADCVPVLVVDPVHRAVGAFHAGWRGTAQGIVEQGIARMREAFGSEPAQLLAAIGPSIGPCCYAVSEDLRASFAHFEYASNLFRQEEGRLRLDLALANRLQLQASGLPVGSITSLAACTSCDGQHFFSHRAEKGHTGRMMAVAGLRKS